MGCLVLNDTLKDDRFVIVDADHPISLGYKVYMWCDHPLCSVSPTPEDMKYLWNGEKGAGMHAVWDNLRIVGLTFHGRERGRVLPLGRMIELIVHESSHAIDSFFDRAAIDRPHTEVRAYYLDWIVGKALHRFQSLWD